MMPMLRYRSSGNSRSDMGEYSVRIVVRVGVYQR